PTHAECELSVRQYPLLYWRTESSPLSQLCASLRSSQDSYSQQVEFRSSIHGPLQYVQPVDVPFCRSAAPFILEGGGHGRAVEFQSCRQTLHLPNSALRHSFHPTRECFPICLLEDNEFHSGILLEPSRQRRRFPVRKEINRGAPHKVHQNRAVTLPFVLRPVIDSDDFWSGGRWQLKLANPLNDCVGADAHP